MNKRTLKFILDVLVTQENDFNIKNKLVQDSLWRLIKDKDRYEKEHQKYLDALELIQSLLQDNTK